MKNTWLHSLCVIAFGSLALGLASGTLALIGPAGLPEVVQAPAHAFALLGPGLLAGWFTRRHPLLVALGVAIVVALRPRNTVNLAISALSLWRLYHRARRVWTLASTLAASTQTHRP